MLLKIFVKRKAHGELCTDAFEWTETISQGDEILKKQTDNGFEFYVNRLDGTSNQVYCPTLTHGFEILTDSGTVIDKYVTAIDEGGIEADRLLTSSEAVAFGNYLLSDDRKVMIKQGGNDHFKEVQHADLENFKEIMRCR